MLWTIQPSATTLEFSGRKSETRAAQHAYWSDRSDSECDARMRSRNRTFRSRLNRSENKANFPTRKQTMTMLLIRILALAVIEQADYIV